MRSVVVAGHVCVDFIPEIPAAAATGPGELLEVGPLAVGAGGCVANTGGDLAALGADVEVVADAGDDELGALLVELLRARGTRTDQIRLREGRSTSYSLVFEPEGQDRSFWHHVGANAEFDGSAVDLAGAGLLHVGYPSLLPALIADGGRPLEALLERARGGRAHHVARPRRHRPRLARRARGLARAAPARAAARRRLQPEHRRRADRAAARRRRRAFGAARHRARAARRSAPAIVMLTAGAAGLQLSTGDAGRLRAAGGLLGERPWSGQEHFTAAAAGRGPHDARGAATPPPRACCTALLGGLDPRASARPGGPDGRGARQPGRRSAPCAPERPERARRYATGSAEALSSA